ncbi:hypothetical protein [Companilactobacillus nodensis]|nr:hypothetical protein [Companilactobacillus nodensis]
MAEENMQKYYDQLDQATTLLKKSLGTSYLDALSENLTNIADGHVFVENGAPDEETVSRLEKIYAELRQLRLTPAQLKQAITVNIIKDQKVDNSEVNKLMTPDMIGLIASLIAFEILHSEGKNELNLIDPTVGTGNFLIEFIQQLQQAGDFKINAAAIDNDDGLVALSKSFSEV